MNSNNLREQVKSLWKRCFNDSDAFIELYFRLRYNDEVNIAIQSGETVIAALQMLPYPMRFEGTEINTSYISGACTHPDYRNRGVMRQLLSQAFQRMWQKGVALSTLIPAEPWLFGYYASCGYAPVFRYAQSTFHATSTPRPAAEYLLQATQTYHPEAYRYLDCKLRERPCCLLHTEPDFRAVLADLKLGGGTLFSLHRSGQIAALAPIYPTSTGGWCAGELLADTPELGTALLRLICDTLHTPSIDVLTPPPTREAGTLLGMARIIHAETMLNIYATAHPDTELDFFLTDEQVTDNNGHYRLSKGICTKSAGQPTNGSPTLTIGSLAEKLFSSSSPYMSLMMN